MGAKFIYGDLVPTDIMDNLKYRREVIKTCAANPEQQRLHWIASARDIKYWINTFVYTHDPRRNDSAVMPFITFPAQDDRLLDIQDAIYGYSGVPDAQRGLTSHDYLVEKSRDMGASWICVLSYLHGWLFQSYRNFLMVSRTQDYVDKTGNPKCMFWKADFVLERIPGWMRPVYTRNLLHLHNEDNGSTIDGESTTGDVARGDRRTSILLDEFAAVTDGGHVLSSVQYATNCVIFNSTYKGTGNAFYDKAQSTIKKGRLHWSDHPEKAMGLYTSEDGALKILDKKYKFDKEYPFILDGKIRSPYYDAECARSNDDRQIAQELDIDPAASGYGFFDQSMLDTYREKYVALPHETGAIMYDRQSGKEPKVTVNPKGNMRFWCQLYDGKPPRDRSYAVSADIAAGTGASNSVLSVADLTTKEKVAEYASPSIDPHEFAVLAVAVAHLFTGPRGPAHMIWESNGPGRIFGGKVLDLGFRNIFYRKQEERLGKPSSDYPGWYSNKDSKMKLLADYRDALSGEKFINRSREAIKECGDYVYVKGGNGVAHISAANTEDPSGARDNHGDRVIADALLWKVSAEHARAEKTFRASVPDVCPAARRAAYEKAKSREGAYAWR